MCIDCTGSMGDLLDTVKNNALKFYPDLRIDATRKARKYQSFAFVLLLSAISVAMVMQL